MSFRAKNVCKKPKELGLDGGSLLGAIKFVMICALLNTHLSRYAILLVNKGSQCKIPYCLDITWQIDWNWMLNIVEKMGHAELAESYWWIKEVFPLAAGALEQYFDWYLTKALLTDAILQPFWWNVWIRVWLWEQQSSSLVQFLVNLQNWLWGDIAFPGWVMTTLLTNIRITSCQFKMYLKTNLSWGVMKQINIQKG